MIKVEERKLPQHNLKSERFFEVKRLYLPLSQHTGRPSKSLVKPRDNVNEAQIIAEGDGLISAHLSAPKKGKVVAIDNFNHPVLKRSPSIFLDCLDDKKRYLKRIYLDNLGKDALLEIIRRAGIVGMGGACFPSHVKLNPPKRVDTLIVNGCECEPYLVCDYRLMAENAEQIFKGVEIIAKILLPREVIFAIEDNKPEAIKRFNLLVSIRKFALPSPKISVLKSAYPQGGEKQLIYKLTKRKVPSGGLPYEVGCLVHNVGTCFAIYEAVYFDKPLIERLVTFGGRALKQPKNIWLKIGTSIKDLFEKKVLEFKEQPRKIVYGGPMMGIALEHLDYPILKGTTGVLFLTKEEIDLQDESSCIRCARCVDSCPMELLPLEYVKRVRHSEFNRLNEFYIKDCIECGICSYVCPAKIPIVHYIKLGKRYAVSD